MLGSGSTPTLSDKLPAPEVVRALWIAGQLAHLLHTTQLEIRTAICLSTAAVFVVCCSRRLGKSFLLCCLAIEQCLQKPGSQVRYAAPTGKDVKKIVLPLLRIILESCPAELRPSFNSQDGVWTFPNGSQIHIAGVNNNHADDLRGAACDLAIVDEAGFVDDLAYLVESVLKPQLLTTDGRIILSSTPPKTPAHEFRDYYEQAERKGSLVKKTIHDAPHIPKEKIAAFCEEAGGENSTTWRREYLCEFVTDEQSAVLPEFSKFRDQIVRDFELPEYYDGYVSTDVGYYDLTFTLTAVTDFLNARLLVVGESVHRQEIAEKIDKGAEDIERATCPLVVDIKADHPHLRPIRRIADAQPLVIAELSVRGRYWAKARNDDPEAGLNGLRHALATGRIWIHPRCKELIAHCNNCIWNKKRTSFDRSDELGHFDGVSALMYLWRDVGETGLRRNPYPIHAKGVAPETHHLTQTGPTRKTVQKLFKGVRG
jgi:hypothetical protein